MSWRVLWILVLIAPHAAWSEDAKPGLSLAIHAPTGKTPCERCHTTRGWLEVEFPHEQTGFVLRESHARAACGACHVGGFEASLPHDCAGCHADVHGGALGRLCQKCHSEDTWRTAIYADAHRRSAFPLLGGHAAVPCEECHVERRTRTFGNADASCAKCHLKQYQSTAGLSIDHVAAGFPTECRSCHQPLRWKSAVYPGHDRCFQLSGGPHRRIECLSCHTTLQGARVDQSCNTRTAACTSCHEHACDRTDRQHARVAGYQCKDRRCYECHRFVED